MKRYMVSVEFPEEKSEVFMHLVPRHIAETERLLRMGRLASYSLNMDRTKAWLLFNGNSEGEVLGLLEGLTLYSYMRVQIEELMVVKTTILQQELIMN